MIPSFFFLLQNIKVKLISRTWITLKSSVMIFHALKPLQPQWPLQLQQPPWPQWPLQPHFIKKILILMISTSLAPKWPILVHFSGMDHQTPTFLLILEPLLLEAVMDSQCYFFENWFVKLKFPNLRKPIGTIMQQNYWSLRTLHSSLPL